MILMKNIIREGHKTLVTVAKEISIPLSQADKKLAFDLMEYVQNSQDDKLAQKYNLRPGVGLAAPQVNVSKRMFAMHCNDLDGKLYSYVMINPIITGRTNEITYIPGGEGCLSIDRPTEGLTPRYYGISVTGYHFDFALDKAVPIELELQGYPAIVFQHENDHLDGIMFTDKLFPDLPQAFPVFELSEDEELED